MQLSSQQRQQPFFKTNTSSTTTSGSYFLNYNAGTHKNGNQTQSLFPQSPVTSRTSSVTGMNFFPPNSTVSRQKEKDSAERETTQTTERLSALHNKLHHEAEKIRKWKTKTDFELSDKTKKLYDANQTIESQRKSMLELQLQNEKLSSKMQEELSGHVELEHKVIGTRELCNVLKDQVFRIDEAVAAGEKDHDELQFMDKQRLEQFQELVVKFQELEIHHSTKHNEMKDKLQKQREKQGVYVAETTQYIQDKDKKIQFLTDEKAEKEIKISALVKDLGENREHLEVTKKEEAVLKDKLKKSESIMTSQDIQLKSSNKMLAYAQDEGKRLVSELHERDSALVHFQEEKLKLECAIKKEENTYILKTESLQVNIRNLQNEIDIHKLRIEELTGNVNTLTTDLENGKYEHDLQKAENMKLQRETEDLNASNEKLVNYQEKLMESLQELEKENDSLQNKTSTLTSSEKELKLAEESFKKLITELEANKVTLEKNIEGNLKTLAEKQTFLDNLQMDLEESKNNEYDMQDKIKKLEELLHEESVNQDNVSSDMQELKEEKQKLSEELEQTNKEIKNLNQQIKALKKTEVELRRDITKSSDQQHKLEAEMEELKAELHKSEQIDQTLDEEKYTTKSLREELNSKEKEFDSLETKAKTMQNQITSKAKQVKDLQQEIKTAKNSSTTQAKRMKVLEKKNATLETETEQRETEKEELEKEINTLKGNVAKTQEQNAKQINEINTLKEHMTKTQEQNDKQINERQQLQLDMDKGVTYTTGLEAEFKRLEKTNEKTLKDMNESQSRFDKERAELCSTLENYKTENERIVAQKERDLDKFRQNKEIEIKTKTKRIKELEQGLEDLLKKSQINIENARCRAIIDKDVEINILKQRLLDKEESTSENEPSIVGNITETPTRVQMVPATPKTPRSILKQSAQPTKKRRVAFSSEQSTCYSSDEDDKAFKVFTPNDKKRDTSKRGVEQTIPTKVVRPNVRHSPGPIRQATTLPKKLTIFQAKNKNKKKDAQKLQEEMEQFKELFPDIPENLTNEKGKKDPTKRKKSSFKSKITKISPRKSDADIDWFDNDAFFGFDG